MDNLQLLVEKLNLKKSFVKNDELHSLCPKHNDKNTGNFSINLSSGKYHCFACGFSGNIINLLFDKDCTYSESFSIWNSVRLNDKEDVELISELISDDIVQSYINNGVSPYALERVEDYTTLILYNIYSDKNGNPIFLVNDFENKTRAIWVDDLNTRKKKKHSYFLLEPLTAKKDGWLFGQHLTPTEQTIIVEGFYDAPNVYYKLEGKYKVVSLMGTHITDGQLETIKKMGNPIFMFDGDDAGRNARKRTLELVTDIPGCKFAGGYRGDPDELTKEQLLDIIKKSKTYLEYFFDVD